MKGEGTATERGRSPHSSVYKEAPGHYPDRAMTCATRCRRDRPKWEIGTWEGTLEGDALGRQHKEATSADKASGRKAV